MFPYNLGEKKSEKLLKTHEKSSIMTIVHKTTRELNVFRLRKSKLMF